MDETRHLLPEEIDLLVDGEEGFGAAPLKAHVRQCDACRDALEDARALSLELEAMPHFSPGPHFADRVMSQVQVFEPAHVAAADAVGRLVPTSRTARVLAGAAAASVLSVMTAATLWIAGRVDLVFFLTNILAARVRTVSLQALTDIAARLLGDTALAALRAGGPSALLGGAFLLLLVLASAAFGLRAAAGAARRRA